MEEPVNQDIINLYDRFTHGAMTRRAFLDRLAELAGSTAAAAALLPLSQNDYARAAIVSAYWLSTSCPRAFATVVPTSTLAS